MESISYSSESDGKVISYRINHGLEFFCQRVLIVRSQHGIGRTSSEDGLGWIDAVIGSKKMYGPGGMPQVA